MGLQVPVRVSRMIVVKIANADEDMLCRAREERFYTTFSSWR